MPIEDLQSAKAYLETLIPKEKEDYEKIGLTRLKALLDKMGNPQDSYPTVHVGGTAGKGSVATMISKITEAAGYKTGLHISPHLQDIRERMQVNGILPKEKDFVDMALLVRDSMEKLGKTVNEKPSYFEALLAITFEHFRREKVDIAIIEVGMGGRLDGTNVIKPMVTVLTNVGLDHMEFLGGTVEKIAREKTGIFKHGIDIVSGVTQPKVVGIVSEKAKEMGCKLDLLGREIKFERVKMRESGSMMDLVIRGERYRDIELSVMGSHQVSNAALAAAAALGLNTHGFMIEEAEVREAFSSMRLPGRFEIMRRNPLVIIDGAHNPMKIDSLYHTFRERYPQRRIAFIFAAKKDKNVREMIKQLSRIASKFYFTSFESTTDFGKRMSYDPNELKCFTDIDSEVISDSGEAYRKAIKDAPSGGMICVTGSFYLVGELRSLI